MKKMHLNHQPFMAIRQGTKQVEIRLNDPKRAALRVGNEIQFTDLETAEIMKVKVIDLERFTTFKELFEKYSGSIIGSPDNESVAELDQENLEIYSREMEQQYGALAIKIKSI